MASEHGAGVVAGAMPADGSRSVKVIGLVSTAHFLSHFYLLLLPPLFPLLRDVYGVGYTELGFAITVFSVVTALTQAPVGFVVDRIGARPVLIAGLLLEAGAFIGIGLVPVYGMLLAMMALAGLANAVYHPADYVILSRSVQPDRMGRAFSIHTSAGMLGNAVGPVTMAALMVVLPWQLALVVCGVVGLAVGLVVAASSGLLVGGSGDGRGEGAAGGEGREAGAGDERASSGPVRTGWQLLLSGPILLGVLFFVGISVAGHGVNGFSVATLSALYDSPAARVTTVLGAYLFASPVGVLAGGWVADRIRRHDLFAASCFVVIGLVFFVIAALRPPLPVVFVLFAVAGLFSGAVSPSRDMLIRSLTPPSEVGKVFGFVSTGFNIGGIVAPVMYGYVLDHASPVMVLWTVGAVSLASVFTVLTTGKARSRGRTDLPA